MRRRLALSLLAVLLAPSAALADADPASDVLIGASVFYPYSPPVSGSLERTLNAEAAAAARAHFPIKVAVIAAPTDLGAIPSFFGKPQQYATFLDQELSFVGPKPPLLVVMANGYGERGLPAISLPKIGGGASNDLVRAAIAGLPMLAAAAGHPIGRVVSGTSSGGGSSSALPVIGLALAAVAAAGAVLAVRSRRRVSR